MNGFTPSPNRIDQSASHGGLPARWYGIAVGTAAPAKRPRVAMLFPVPGRPSIIWSLPMRWEMGSTSTSIHVCVCVPTAKI